MRSWLGEESQGRRTMWGTAESTGLGGATAYTMYTWNGRSFLMDETVEYLLTDKDTMMEYMTLGHTEESWTYLPAAGSDLQGLPRARAQHKGPKVCYIYERGTYATNTFTPSTNGVHWRVTAVNGADAHVGSVDEFGHPETWQSNWTTNYLGHKVEWIALHPHHSTVTESIYVQGRMVQQDTRLFTSLTNTVLLGRELYERNDLGRLIGRKRVDVSTGAELTLYSAEWTGDLKMSETDDTGGSTAYTYDALRRPVTTTRAGLAAAGGYAAQADTVITKTYDVRGNTLSQILSSGSLAQTNTWTYDISSRPLTAGGPHGTTNFTYEGLVTTMTLPGGGTRIQTQYLDGRLKSVTGDTVVPEYHQYYPVMGGWGWPGPNASHQISVHVTTLGYPTSPRWKRVYRSDEFGPYDFSAHIPSYTNGVLTETYYQVYGRPLGASGFGNPYTAISQDYKYDAVRRNTVVPFGGPTFFDDKYYQQLGGEWFFVEQSSVRTNSSPEQFTPLKTVWQRVTGLGTNVLSHTIQADHAAGVYVTNVVTIDRAAKKITETTTSSAATNAAVRVVINGRLQSETSPSVATPTTYEYDDFGRVTKTISPLGFASTTAYDALTGWVTSTTDPATNTTTYAYYPVNHANAGQLKTRTDANGKKTHTAYNSRGQPTHIWGDVPYPQRMVYDGYGQMVELHTFRGGQGWTGDAWPTTTGVADVTKWTYQESTGLLLAKTDAQNRSVTYTYDHNNRLKTRTWARGVVTTYTEPDYGTFYKSIAYSDGTPTVTFSSFDPLTWQPRTILDGNGTNTLTYDLAGRLTSHTLNGILLTNSFGTTHPGRAWLALLQGGTNLFTHTYAYEAGAGRLATVSDGTHTASYGYLANSDLVASTVFDAGAGAVLTTGRGYDFGARLRGITNLADSVVVTSHTYAYDNTHRRTQATLQDGSHWDYAYSDRNELTGGVHKWSDDMPVDGRMFGYGYDSIGNRLREQVGASGPEARVSEYTVNSLNQVIRRTVPGVVDVAGLAVSNATVTVNHLATSRHGEYWHRAVGVDNDADAAYAAIKINAVQNYFGEEDEDIVDETSGHAFVPQNPEGLFYDADGNVGADGRWAYSWDGENRLVGMEVWEDLPAGARRKLAFSYDWQGRRTGKVVWTWNTSTNGYQQVSGERFVYDGWNLIGRFDTSPSLTLKQSFLWGNDLSGSMDGAGGVGGLLGITSHLGPLTSHFACYDGNGNVTALVDASGATTATYEYSPFGGLLRCEGEYARANPFRFSSKFTDDETGLLYYGYRFYSPTLGRWISRDPIEEEGGLNLHAFIANQPASSYDVLGQSKGGKRNIWGEGFGPNSDPDDVEKALKDALENGQKKRAKALRGMLKVLKRGGAMVLVASLGLSVYAASTSTDDAIDNVLTGQLSLKGTVEAHMEDYIMSLRRGDTAMADLDAAIAAAMMSGGENGINATVAWCAIVERGEEFLRNGY